MTMNLYVNDTFKGRRWPVGTCAIVIDEDADQAAAALEAELAKRDMPQSINADSMRLVCWCAPLPLVNIVRDGEY